MRNKIKKIVSDKGIWRTAGLFLTFFLLVFATNWVFSQMSAITYDGTEFKSHLVGDGQERSVSGGESGYLTFGPYLTLSEGDYAIRVYYSADTDGNYIDMVSSGGEHHLSKLKADEKIHAFDVHISQENVKNVEIRTYYAGTGSLSIEKVVIQEYNVLLPSILSGFNMAVVAVVLVYIGYLAGRAGLFNTLKKRRILYCVLLIGIIGLITVLMYVAGVLYVENDKNEQWPISSSFSIVIGVLLEIAVINALFCRLTKEKQQASKMDLGQVLRLIPIPILFAGSFFCFPAFSLYYGNTKDFTFGIFPVVILALFTLVVCAGLLGLILLIVSSNIIRGNLICFIFSLGLGSYLQYNFFNFDFGLLNGSSIDWVGHVMKGIAGTAMWLVVFAVPLMLIYLCPKPSIKILQALSMFLIMVQGITIATLILTTPQAEIAKFRVTDSNLLDVSDENIIVFVLDTFDEQVFQELRNSGVPEVSDEALEDFVSFTNCISGGAPTSLGMPLLLTGQMTSLESESQSEYLKRCFNDCRLYHDLSDCGYNIGLYTHTAYLKYAPVDLLQNVAYGDSEVHDIVQFTRTWYKFCAFLTLPQQLKPFFTGSTEEFDFAIGVRGYSGTTYHWSTQWDRKFYLSLSENNLNYIPNEKNFRLYHMVGIHGSVEFLNENMEFSDIDLNTLSTTMVAKQLQGRGELMMIGKYIQMLKDLNVYDNTTIVITADHGTYVPASMYSYPMALVKPRNYHAPYSENNAPVHFTQFHATLASEFLDEYSSYGESYFDVPENEVRDRLTIVTNGLLKMFGYNDYNPDLYATPFLFHGHALDGFERVG